MNEKAFGAAIENVIDALDPHSNRLPDVDIPIIHQARAELVNLNMCLDALKLLVHCNTTEVLSMDWLMAWRRAESAIAACRAETGKNQNA